MNMYREHYAACVIVDGKVLPETKDGTVVLPFGTEYQIRLRNKSRVRSVADVILNGETAVKGVVLDPDARVDLERYLDGNLNQGARFKFVPLNDGRVEQPGDSQNGLLEVKFYQEKAAPKVETIVHHETVVDHVTHHIQCWNPRCRICNPWHLSWGGPIYMGNTQTGGVVNRGDGMTLSSSCCSFDTESSKGIHPIGEVHDSCDVYAADPCRSVKGTPEAGATVKGSMSGQQFSSVYMEVDTTTCVTLSLKLMGVKPAAVRCECKRKPKKGDNFCPSCGKSAKK